MSDEKFQEVFSDVKFVKMLLNLETGERVRKALAEKGIVLTEEDLDKFAEVLVKVLQDPDAMSEDDLAGVTGGAYVLAQEIKKLLDADINPQSWILSKKS